MASHITSQDTTLQRWVDLQTPYGAPLPASGSFKCSVCYTLVWLCVISPPVKLVTTSAQKAPLLPCLVHAQGAFPCQSGATGPPAVEPIPRSHHLEHIICGHICHALAGLPGPGRWACNVAASSALCVPRQVWNICKPCWVESPTSSSEDSAPRACSGYTTCAHTGKGAGGAWPTSPCDP